MEPTSGRLPISLRTADPDPGSEDCRCIWEWRNDSQTRRMSRSTEPIPWEMHAAWYSKAAKDPSRCILLLEVEGTPAAMVRFDRLPAGPSGPEAEVNIVLAPSQRGRGLGRPLLGEACRFAFRSLGLSRIRAEVKAENRASLRIFEGTGFVFETPPTEPLRCALEEKDLRL